MPCVRTRRCGQRSASVRAFTSYEGRKTYDHSLCRERTMYTRVETNAKKEGVSAALKHLERLYQLRPEAFRLQATTATAP